MAALMTGGTITSEGIVPHLVVKHDGLRILAPVKIDFDSEARWVVRQQAALRAPLRRDGRLVFALPGGGEVLA